MIVCPPKWLNENANLNQRNLKIENLDNEAEHLGLLYMLLGMQNSLATLVNMLLL